MLENDRIETASTEVTSIWRRNDIEKSTWRTHRYFVDFESRIHVEISTSNRCHNSHVYSPFKIDIISTNVPRGISTSNPWRIDEDVSIGIVWNAEKLTYMHDLTWVINNVNMCICVSMYICLCACWGVYVYKFFFLFYPFSHFRSDLRGHNENKSFLPVSCYPAIVDALFFLP